MNDDSFRAKISTAEKVPKCDIFTPRVSWGTLGNVHAELIVIRLQWHCVAKSEDVRALTSEKVCFVKIKKKKKLQ